MPLRLTLPAWRLSRLVVDLVAGGCAVFVAFLLRTSIPLPFTLGLLPDSRLQLLQPALWLVVVVQCPLLYFFGFYELPHPEQRIERLRRLFVVAVSVGLFLVVCYFFLNRPFPRTVVVLFVVLDFLLLFGGRALLEVSLLPPRRRAAVVGAARSLQAVGQVLADYPWFGIEIVGHFTVADNAATFEDDSSFGQAPGEYLGTVEDLPRIVEEHRIDEILVAATTAGWRSHLVDGLAKVQRPDLGVLLLPSPFESLVGSTRFRVVHDLPFLEVSLGRGGAQLWKRALDMVFAATGLVLASPLIAACALGVKLTSPGPALFLQERIGLHRRPFVLWKLRTMRLGAEEAGEETLATEADPRKTRFGALLRRLRLDELPQLWNVLNGSMSLVGPRPERPGFVGRFLDEVPGYAARFLVRPGVTGLAQVNGDYRSTAATKLRYDLAYVANASLWLDLVILLRTARIVMTSRGI